MGYFRSDPFEDSDQLPTKEEFTGEKELYLWMPMPPSSGPLGLDTVFDPFALLSPTVFWPLMIPLLLVVPLYCNTRCTVYFSCPRKPCHQLHRMGASTTSSTSPIGYFHTIYKIIFQFLLNRSPRIPMWNLILTTNF